MATYAFETMIAAHAMAFDQGRDVVVVSISSPHRANPLTSNLGNDTIACGRPSRSYIEMNQPPRSPRKHR